MAAEGQEVGAEVVDVGRQVGHVLAGVDTQRCAGGVCGIGDATHRCQGAEHVGHRRDRDELGAIELAIEIIEAEHAVVTDGQPAQLDAPFGREHVPRHDVGVVLHLGEYDDVTGLQVGTTPRMGDEVE